MNTRATIEEGVTQFDLVYTPSDPLAATQLQALIAWREIFRRLGLIGLDPARYGGVGYGNVSRRLPSKRRAAARFAITGTQTGALAALDARHFAIVTAFHPERNRVEAEGPLPPSSESMTHGMLYRLDSSIRFVFHVHSPELWRAAKTLGLPRTAENVGYGTPAMAQEMTRLRRAGAFARRRLLVMGGHEDGVIAFGRTAEQAGAVLLRALAEALVR